MLVCCICSQCAGTCHTLGSNQHCDGYFVSFTRGIKWGSNGKTDFRSSRSTKTGLTLGHVGYAAMKTEVTIAALVRKRSIRALYECYSSSVAAWTLFTMMYCSNYNQSILRIAIKLGGKYSIVGSAGACDNCED